MHKIEDCWLRSTISLCWWGSAKRGWSLRPFIWLQVIRWIMTKITRVAVIPVPVLISMTIVAISRSRTVVTVRITSSIRGRIHVILSVVVIIIAGSQTRQSIRFGSLTVAALMTIVTIINLGMIPAIRLFDCSTMMRAMTVYRLTGNSTRCRAWGALFLTVPQQLNVEVEGASPLCSVRGEVFRLRG